MVNQYFSFDESFPSKIKDRTKTETLRYKDRDQLPNEGEVVSAITSYDSGEFAKLRITNVEPLTVKEIINSHFEGHKNYDSLKEFNEHLNQYYDKQFTFDDRLYLIQFEVVEWLGEDH